MKITRTLLLAVIGAVLLAGLTNPVQAEPTTQPADKSGTAPVIDEGDNVTGDETSPETTPSVTSSGQATSQPADGTSKTRPSFFSDPMFLLIGAMLLMFVFMGRGKRKKEAQRKEMLSALKKGDRVTTIGGIIGTVMEVRDDEVAVKIDEGNNVRMRFARWAVRGVGDQAKSENPEQKK